MLRNLFYLKSNFIYENDFIYKIEIWSSFCERVNLSLCFYNISKYKNNLFLKFNIFFPKEIQNSCLKRKAEFLAGRISAKNAISSLCNISNIPIVHIGLNRSPVWPKNIIGSITHNNKKAISIVCKNKHFKGIGIDIENVLNVATAKEIQNQIHTDKELECFLIKKIPTNIATTIIFSAKESLFKAIYNQVNKYFDFNICEVSLVSNNSNKIYLRIIDKFLNDNPYLNKYYQIQYKYNSIEVFTCVMLDLNNKQHVLLKQN